MATVYYEDYIEDTTEKYDESQDEDFHPDDVPQAGQDSSSSDDDGASAKPTPRSGKRKAPADDELDSGDEVTIQAARKKKKKKSKKLKKQRKGHKNHDNDNINTNNDDDDGDEDDDNPLLSDSEGGLIKTRAQRRVEKVQRRPLARTDGATIDVDALWALMTAAPLKPVQPTAVPDAPVNQPAPAANAPLPLAAVHEEEQIIISKTYTFAGQDTTEEKSVPRSHIQKYISDGWRTSDAADKPAEPDPKPKANTSKIRRPLRRPSRFDANPTGYVRTLAPEHQLTYPRATATATATISANGLMPPPELPAKGKEKAHKLNVVDKSRMDWTGFVDKEGIAEELDTHGKTKEAYLGRMDFLAGVEARREEERKRVKVAAGTM
jgi:hypothetical protein